MTITRKKMTIGAVSSLVIFVLLVFAYKVNLCTGGNCTESIDENFPSKEYQAQILKIADSGAKHELIEFFDENPDLLKKLSDGIQSKPLDSGFSEADSKRFSSSASMLNSLLVASRNAIEHDQLVRFESERPKLGNYLAAYVSLKRRQKNGIVSLHDATTQNSLSEATKLLFDVQLNQNDHEKLSQLVEWYALEKQSNSKIGLFATSLLHNAWALSAESLGLQLKGFEVEHHLQTSSDLVRLLNHENRAVATNAAGLMRYFSPENSITAIRFQLARSRDSRFSFLLLDALKSYGQYRHQFEPQLNKMLRLTADNELKNKIMETIDHLHGRSNELLSKSNQTK